jgi:hypothetical protein
LASKMLVSTAHYWYHLVLTVRRQPRSSSTSFPRHWILLTETTYVVFPRFVCRPTFKAMRQRNVSEVTSTPLRCLVRVSRYFWAGSQKAWEERPLVQAMDFSVKRGGEGERR